MLSSAGRSLLCISEDRRTNGGPLKRDHRVRVRTCAWKSRSLRRNISTTRMAWPKRQGLLGHGSATSHFDTTLAPTHDDIPTTRYAAHNYDDVTSGDGRE